MVLEAEEVSAILASLESTITEAHLLFEEVKTPASHTIDDPNDLENDNTTFSKCINEIYGVTITGSQEESKGHPNEVTPPSDEEQKSKNLQELAENKNCILAPSNVRLSHYITPKPRGVLCCVWKDK